jgi:hypothetical protein
MKIRLILITALVISLQTPTSHAADCVKACVDVYTQDGQLVIEARKGSGPSSSKVTKPKTIKPGVVKPKVVSKPKVITKPKPVVKPKVAAPVKKAPAKPAKKPVKKALPTGGISYQPNFKPLIHTPVYFWNDLPSVFRTQVNLIGESIDVVLRPSYVWSFGDGSFFATTDPGGPFPEGKVTHIYSQPGIYPVLLTTTWNGSFSHNAVERAITGQIKKVSALTITVVAAPTRFMN